MRVLSHGVLLDLTAGLIAVVCIACTSSSLPVAGTSPQCGQVVGATQVDLDRLMTFCAKGVAPGAVVNADANDSLLTVSVSREMADSFRVDRLAGEQLLTLWLKGWRQVTDRKAVTVTVKWQDVEIATGDTTITGGDRVTIR